MKPWFENIIKGAYGIESEPSYYGDSRVSELSDDVANYQNVLEESFKMEIEDTVLKTTAMNRMIEQSQQKLERAIRGAIRAGYDGVDIHRPVAFGVGIESIEPWNRPEPDGANGHRTERYTWDWFSDDELTRMLTDDEYMEELQR